MHLIQLLLPLADNDGNEFPAETLRGIQKELCDRFGGVTAYSRSPAEGIWTTGGAKQKDEIIIVEVMVDELDRSWWKSFRIRLEKLLRQEKLVVRAHELKTL